MRILTLVILLVSSVSLAQTSALPTNVDLYDGSDNPIGSTAGALDVHCTNCSGGGGAGGDVNVTNTSIPVTGTFFQSVQPVSGPLTDAQLRATAVPVSGTFFQSTQPVSAASLPLPSGASTSANQATALTSLSSIDGKLPALSGGRIPVDGSGVTQPVSGTFWQATQPVSGSVSVSNFPATQPVSGTITANIGTIGAAATAANQATEITSLSSIDGKTPALASGRVPVDGSGVLQPTQLKDSFGNVIDFLTAGTTQALPVAVVQDAGTAGADSTTINASGIYYFNSGASPPGQANQSAYLIISGTWTGSISAGVDASGGSAGLAVPFRKSDNTLADTITANGSYRLETEIIYAYLNVTVTSGTIGLYWVSDNISFSTAQLGDWNLKNITGTVSLPTGASTAARQDTGNTSLSSIDTKTPSLGQAAMTGSTPVVIANNQSAVPVSIATAPALVASSAIIGKVDIDQTTPGTTNGVQVNAALPAGSNVIGHVIVDTAPSTAVTNTGTFATQSTLQAETTKVIGTVNVASGQTLATVTNLSQLGGANISMNSGTRDAGTQRVSVATDDVVPVSNAATTVTGSASGTNQDLCAATDVSKYGSVSLQILNTFVGTVSFQGSNDNSNFVAVTLASASTPTTGPVSSTTSTGLFYGMVNFKYFRVRMTVFTSGQGDGTCVFKQTGIPYGNGNYIRLTDGGGNTIPKGQNTMANGLPVSIASDQTSIPVAATLGAETTKVIGTVNQGTSPWVSSSAQSGTWTVQPGNTANTTPWLFTLNDGTNTAKVTAASTAAAAADKALVVSQNPSGGNPCLNPSSTLVSITGATSTTNATQIIGLSGTTKIYICSMTIIGVSGTSPTFSLVQGTGSNCVTGQTNVVQAWATTAGTLYAFANPVAVGVAGNELCYKDGGTSPVQNYQINYVQQ